MDRLYQLMREMTGTNGWGVQVSLIDDKVVIELFEIPAETSDTAAAIDLSAQCKKILDEYRQPFAGPSLYAEQFDLGSIGGEKLSTEELTQLDSIILFKVSTHAGECIGPLMGKEYSVHPK